jgi:hypothetical protein
VFAVLATAVAAAATIGRAQSEAHALPARVAAPASELATLLGFSDSRLVELDPETLQPLTGRSMAVGSGGCAPRQGGTSCWANPPWAVSPDGRRLAIVDNDSSLLRLVDVGQIRVASTLRRGRPGAGRRPRVARARAGARGAGHVWRDSARRGRRTREEASLCAPTPGWLRAPAQDVVAEVDLRSLAVSYHSLERPRSLLSRLWNWIESAAAKQVSRYHRHARWLGGAASSRSPGSSTLAGGRLERSTPT